MRLPKIDGLLAAAAQSERPVKSISYDGSTLHVEFFDSREASVAAPAVTPPLDVVATDAAIVVQAKPEPPKYVPGTTFIDDKSPLNPLDLVLSPPTIALDPAN